MGTKLSRAERFQDSRLYHNKNGKETIREVAEKLNFSKTVLEALENDNDERDVGYSKIKVLAEHYGVSADYLLGLDDCPSIEHNHKVVQAITGLSPKSIKALNFLNETKNEKYCTYNKYAIAFLNRVLERAFEMIQEKSMDDGASEVTNGVPTILGDLENYINCKNVVGILPKGCKKGKEAEQFKKYVIYEYGGIAQMIPYRTFVREFAIKDIESQLNDLMREGEK